MGNSTSKWQSVYKGSAQGSVIGPLSYNIFSNDMLSILDNDINRYNYADDNTLTSSGYDYDVVQVKLVRNIEKVMQWFEENDMKIIKLILTNSSTLYLVKMKVLKILR